jgi:hypothetical protein
MAEYRLVHLEAGHCVPWPHGRLTIKAHKVSIRYGSKLWAMARLENTEYGGTMDSPKLAIEATSQRIGTVLYSFFELIPKV